MQGVTEAGCLAHARPKFHELWVNHKSSLAEEALKLFGRLYDLEREVQQLDAEERRRQCELRAKPVADLLHAWPIANRLKVPDGSSTAKAIQYRLGRWTALTRYLGEARLPADNSRLENLIRPIALGRANLLFAGNLRAGQRAAAIMSLVHSARLNGHDPYAYLKDVLERLPTPPASRIAELLPYRWQAAAAALHPDRLGGRPRMKRTLIDALGQASSLELFHLSTILDRLISDPSRILKIRARLHLGQSVRFLDWRHLGPEAHLTAARVVAMKDTQVIVREEGTGREWKLPYAAIDMPEAAAEGMESDAEPALRAVQHRATRNDFSVGDRVSFDDRHLQAHVGTVVRINQKTATVDCDGHRWRVSFGLLHPVHEL